MDGYVTVSEDFVSPFADAITAALRPSNPSPVQDGYAKALDVLMDWEAERFLVFSGHGGDWPDHAPSTKLAKAYKHGYHRGRHRRGEITAIEEVLGWEFPLLRETDALIESLKAGSPDHERIYTDESAIAQSNIWYGHFHQDGGDTPGRPPQRQFIIEPPEEVLLAAGVPIGEGLASVFSGGF